MFDKLAFIEERYEELSKKISDPEVIADQEVWRKYCKEHADITPIVNKYKEYKKVNETITEAKQLLNEKLDKDFKEMVELELEESKEKIEKIKEELKILLLPKDPNDEKNVIVEIRGGAGGEEAALFAADLLRMYSRYAERKRWKVEMMNSNPTDIGGYKEVAFMIEGQGAYSRLKFESGVHRVQRIPSTESGGRIHTSTVTVAVLPEVEDVEVEINPNDLRIDVFRAGGPGGQCVNTTDSAVRITHLPTGLVVSCQDEKSQHKNKDKAMKILRSRLYELMQEQQNAEIAQARKSQVGTGDRSERIRTYNFPQGRVTDHRIGLTLHKIETILDGDLDEIIDALITSEQSEKLKEASA
ncbi:MAG: peptide chain release factor 1 [Petroclostridium sp.]|jgi:peptide chain release factor 1|uniref:peptide chain release factor 1 n=1 Tax=Petroclostridium xylanilyticum TaxID=1792311 RepID=UPI000B993924|nr:peptide chain release factor 1 [Petroclostridium xylanilyticum]MBZ4646192.1 bacterial peptide chain release factor 1 (bRF) [Clostridia bacterium]MDK2810393.1 peptide chain release factor 1 [Petroclostridium sp.]